MIGGQGSEEGLQRIDLATSPDFDLGPLRVRPSHRQVCRGETCQGLEPRVMQVLVALASARPDVVSRDQLIRLCWDGRVVGDDTINRCILALRHLAKSFAPEPFTIKTVPRVGYALLETQAADRPAPTPAAVASPPPRLRWPILAAVAALVAVVGTALLVFRPWQTPDASQVAVAAGDGPGAAALARDLAADLARLAAGRAGGLAVAASAEAPSDYLVRVVTGRDEQAVRAEVSLASSGGGELLWAARFAAPANRASQLREQIGVRLGALLLCATNRAEQTQQLDFVALRLFLNACDRADEMAGDADLASLNALAERAPRFAPGLAMLADAEADLGRFWVAGPAEQGDNPQKQAFRRAARMHLLQAREIDPTLGLTYLTEEELLPRDRWAERIALLERGLAVEPARADLYSSYSQALFAVGRVSAAVENAQRAVALDPLSPQARASLVSTLAYSGRHDEARRVLDEAERLWPTSDIISDARYRLELRYGDPETALRLFDRHQSHSGPVDQSLARARALMAARVEPSPANVERALSLLSQGRVDVSANANSVYLMTLGQFGQLDEAYRLLEQPNWRAEVREGADVYFRDYLRPMRLDPRFMRLAARIGLMQVWQQSGRWPDFCQDVELPYDCRTEAARLSGPA